MRLPALRPDLQLSPAAAARDGAPRWTLADPLRGRYFQLGEASLRLLRHWRLGDPVKVLAAANAEGTALAPADLEQTVEFLRRHDLLSATDPAQRASFTAKAQAARPPLWQRLLHQYLFFRIPLWRPDRFLGRSWPWLARIGPTLLRVGLPLVLVLGLFLVLRDWARFTSTFPHLFSLGGMAAFGSALIFAKLCHEFGHAYMAKRAGCHVQSMGLAFIVLFPLFYTDVSDAWRVRDRRARLLIGAGGILAELALACVALLAWSLLPDGPWRTAAFMLASATWLTTLAVNLNPLMRFDGYFLLSDLWGVENLQQRAFALCRWQLREGLFGFGEPMPEAFDASLRRRLLLWGYASWIWRALLFFGIALAVYHLFFKLLGIVLMLVELGWFLYLPVSREAREWWARRHHAHRGRVLLTGTALTLLLLALAVPWHSTVEVPALLQSSRASTLHAPLPARLKAVHVEEGQAVAAGELLVELDSPDLEARQRQVRLELQITQLQLKRQAGRDETAGDVAILEQRLGQALAEYRGLQAQRGRLAIRAPHAGTVHDLLVGLHAGRWLAMETPLLRVVTPRARVQGYVPEDALWRIEPGAAGRFIADDPMRAALPVRLEELAATGARQLDLEALTSDHGGPIAVRRSAEYQPVPLQGQYAADFAAPDAPPVTQPVRGVVRLEARSESLLASLWRRLAALAVRESGF